MQHFLAEIKGVPLLTSVPRLAPPTATYFRYDDSVHDVLLELRAE
jgi:hypothetical protein